MRISPNISSAYATNKRVIRANWHGMHVVTFSN